MAGVPGLNIQAILKEQGISSSAYYRHRAAGLSHEEALVEAAKAKIRGPRHPEPNQESISDVSRVLRSWKPPRRPAGGQ